MTRSHSLTLTLTLLTPLVGAVAHAQEPLPPPPPVYVQPPPPPVYAPPPMYLQPPYVPSTDPVELDHRGHKKKVIGAVLMGVGAAFTVAGLGLMIDGVNHVECRGHEEHAVCTPPSRAAEAQVGTIAVVAGQLMLIAGIPVYIVGGSQVAKARRLSGQLSLQPLTGNAGSGAMATLALRF